MNRIRMILFVTTFVAVGCGGEVSEQPSGQTAPPDETESNADICESSGFCCASDGFCDVADCAEADPDCEFCGVQDDLCVLPCPGLDPDCTNIDLCEGLGQCCAGDSRCDEDCPQPDSDCKVHSDEDIQNATWIVIAFSLNDLSSLTATAFGVAPDTLATNAHVAQALIDLYSANSDAVAGVFQHETGDFREITTAWAHPEYAPGTTTPDVGLLKVDEEIPNHLALADADVLQALDVFDEVSLCGFPGSVTLGIDFADLLTTGGDFRPRATCLRGTISALRPFDPSNPATPENTFLIQYGISTEPGVSGSAVFNKRGEVIGVHAWGLSSEGEQNFAIRSDKLAELMARADQGQVAGVVLSDIEPQNDPDSDGIADTLDDCPNDPNKSEPGECGCGIPDVDTDQDGTPDCNDDCPNDPNKAEPGICGCGFADTDGCGELLARPLDGVIVLSDLSVWSVFSSDEPTVSTWLVGDRVTVSESFGTSTLTNVRTSEIVSAFFDGIGIRLTIVVFQDQEFGPRLISFSNGTTWEIFFSDENESLTWEVGDEVVLFKVFSTFDKVINLRTGRVISLF